MLFFIIFIISIILLILSLIVSGFIQRKYDKLCWCDDENNNKYKNKKIKISKALECTDNIFYTGIIITGLVFICFMGCVIYSSMISGGKMELESSDKITPISSTAYYLEDDKYYYFNTSDKTVKVPKSSAKSNIKYVESETDCNYINEPELHYDSDFKLFLPHNQLREYYRVNTEDFKALVDSFKLS